MIRMLATYVVHVVELHVFDALDRIRGRARR